MPNHSHSTRFRIAVVVAVGIVLLAPGANLAGAAEQKTFPTPNAAMAALVTAIRSHATEQVMSILGPELETFNATRDKTQDAIDREMFLDSARVLKFEKQDEDPNTVVAYMGVAEWPFPAPLVKTPAGWKFDGKAGVEEIIDRQIGRNELAAIEACQTYIEAQLEYFSADRTGDGYLQFAQKIKSTPGRFDGLYWSNANGEEMSPLGPYAAQAAAAESDELAAVPLSGYYFKILTAQGGSAVGGVRRYVIDGRMLTGFALVAWPAEHGVTGNATFIVNQRGVVYQKDLGAETDQAARAMTHFDPDSTWQKAE